MLGVLGLYHGFEDRRSLGLGEFVRFCWVRPSRALGGWVALVCLVWLLVVLSLCGCLGGFGSSRYWRSTESGVRSASACGPVRVTQRRSIGASAGQLTTWALGAALVLGLMPGLGASLAGSASYGAQLLRGARPSGIQTRGLKCGQVCAPRHHRALLAGLQ